MKFPLFIHFVCGIMLCVALISAEQIVAPSQQYSKILLSPYYFNSLNANQNYSTTVTIEVPDGLSSVKSAIISSQLFVTPPTTVHLWVNGRLCNTPQFSVGTGFSAGQTTVSFDCSNIITQKGTYTITVNFDKMTGAGFSWLDLTYANNPTGNLNLHGTEYQAGQNSKLWIQLLDANGTTISNGVCYIDIYTPSNQQFIERGTMTNMNHDGIYYYDLTAPTEQGVYPVIALCYYLAGESNNFATSVFMGTGNGTIDSGSVDDTKVADGTYLLTTESSVSFGNPRRIIENFNFTDTNGICANISELLLTGITLDWSGRWNSNIGNDVITFELWNYTSSSWIDLPNTITGVGTGTKSVSNSIPLMNITKSGLTSNGNTVRLRMIDTSLADTGSTGLDTDYLDFKCDQLASPVWQSAIGSNEIHVSSTNKYYIDENSFTVVNTTSFNGNNLTYYTGIFIDNFTVESGVSKNYSNEKITFTPFSSLPCNSIQKLYHVNLNGSLTQIPFVTTTGTSSSNLELCMVEFTQNLTKGGIDSYIVYARNTWESDIRSTKVSEDSIAPLLSAGCDLWAISTNQTPFPYVVPANQTYPSNTPYYRACSLYYDNSYWFVNQTYRQLMSDKSNITNKDTFLQYEADYYSTKFASEKLNTLTYLLIDDVMASGIYSQIVLGNPLNRSDVFQEQFWANVSTSQLNNNLLKSINLTSIWNYTNRTLTAYPVQVDMTNYSKISNVTASDIWNYSGTININILSQFANSIWNWVSRYIHGELAS